jgi:ABC-2 type transport system permease protein
MNVRFTLLEIRRILRAPRFYLMGIGIPVVMFLLLAGVYGQGRDGTAAVSYLMASMAAFGAMTAALNTGARIASERSTGWNRLLRLTPLHPLWYVVSKLIVAMAVALPVVVLVYTLGATVEGIDLSPSQWLQSGASLWLGVIPFALLGVVLGYAAKPDSVQVVSSAVFLGLSMFGGLWFPVEIMPRFLASVAKVMPSYWLGDVARSPLLDGHVSMQAVLTLTAWGVVAAVVAARAYRRDAARS